MVSIGWPAAIRKSGLHVTAEIVTLRLANFHDARNAYLFDSLPPDAVQAMKATTTLSRPRIAAGSGVRRLRRCLRSKQRV